MSGMQIDMKFMAVANSDEHQPAWLIGLSDETGKSCAELIEAMLRNEMYMAGENLIRKFPGMFRGGLT